MSFRILTFFPRCPIKRFLPLTALLVLAGCGSDSPTSPGTIPTNHREPAPLFDAWVQSLEQLDLDAQAALLEDSGARGVAGFLYRPPTEDVPYLRWMRGQVVWDRADELAMLGNLLDPEWVQRGTGWTVQDFQVDFEITHVAPNLSSGETVVLGNLSAALIFGPEESVTVDVRLASTLVEDANGYLRIRSQDELPLLEGRAGDAAATEAMGWGRLKAMFRDGVPTDHTDPAAVVAAWTTVLEEGDQYAMTRLLEEVPAGRADPGFRYFPRPEDGGDFPWLIGDSWDRAEELRMIGHLFDPEFLSGDTGNAVDRIEADAAIQSRTDLPEGEIELTVSMDFIVLWATNTGATADTRIIFLLAPDADGFLRIRSQTELAPFRRVEPLSWGLLKALYR